MVTRFAAVKKSTSFVGKLKFAATKLKYAKSIAQELRKIYKMRHGKVAPV